MSKSKLPAPSPFVGGVSPEWRDRGVWLSEASVALADGNSYQMLEMMKEGNDRFAELQDGLTAEVFASLSDRKWRDRDAELTGEALVAWQKYRGAMTALRLALTARLVFGTLIAFGDRDRPGADPEWIPVKSWVHLKGDDRTRNKVFGESGSYWYVQVVDPSLRSAGESAITHTGMQGRPSTKHLWFAEFQRRAEREELDLTSAAAEARHLAEWHKRTHPSLAPPTAKTIRNKILDEYGRIKRAPKNIA